MTILVTLPPAIEPPTIPAIGEVITIPPYNVPGEISSYSARDIPIYAVPNSAGAAFAICGATSLNVVEKILPGFIPLLNIDGTFEEKTSVIFLPVDSPRVSAYIAVKTSPTRKPAVSLIK